MDVVIIGADGRILTVHDPLSNRILAARDRDRRAVSKICDEATELEKHTASAPGNEPTISAIEPKAAAFEPTFSTLEPMLIGVPILIP